MLLDLKLAHAFPPLIPRRTARRLLTLELCKCSPRGRHALLSAAQLLRAHEDPRPRGAAPPDIVPLGSYDRVAEDERNRLGHFIWVADKGDCGPHFSWREILCVLQFLEWSVGIY